MRFCSAVFRDNSEKSKKKKSKKEKKKKKVDGKIKKKEVNVKLSL
jgi:hypothetical protein